MVQFPSPISFKVYRFHWCTWSCPLYTLVLYNHVYFMVDFSLFVNYSWIWTSWEFTSSYFIINIWYASIQSGKSAVNGAVKVAKKQGMIAAYLNVIAIVAALVVACLVMGLVLGLYGPVYTRNQFCNDYRNGYFNNYYYINEYERMCRYS